MLKRVVWENLEMVLIAFLIVSPVRYFLVQPFVVHGSSMEPNFYSNDYLVVDELSYRFRSPERYEVVVFKAPNQPKQYYIKRIIGLPKETVIIEEGKISVIDNSGKMIDLKEEFLPPSSETSGKLKITLKENQLFVLGDNRASSYDSRNWGPLERDRLVGRVWFRLWPLALSKSK